MSTELARVPHARDLVTTRSRGEWSEEQVALIQRTVAKGATREQLGLFLELAAKYQLDPFAKEIWCAVPKGKDGAAPDPDKVLIFVGRDGFLKIANRSDDYRGMKSRVVYEGDEFAIDHSSDGGPQIVHKTTGFPKVGPNTTDAERANRGILGAYAIVYREGMEPTFFLATWTEYVPEHPKKLQFSPWGNQPSAMMLKVAEHNALKKAFSITGVLAEEESERVIEQAQQAAVGEAEVVASSPLLGDDPVVAAHLRNLYAAANESQPVEPFPKAKVRLELAGLDAEGREAKIGELEAWLQKHGVAVPERPEPEEVEEVEAEVVPEAEDAQEGPPEAQEGEAGDEGGPDAQEPLSAAEIRARRARERLQEHADAAQQQTMGSALADAKTGETLPVDLETPAQAAEKMLGEDAADA